MGKKAFIRLRFLIVTLIAFVVFAGNCLSQSNYGLASKLATSREYNLAKKIYKQSIQYFKENNYPDSVYQAYIDLQYCYSNEYKLDSAIIVLKEATQYTSSHLGPGDSLHLNVKMSLGELYYMLGDNENAKQEFNSIYNASSSYPYYISRSLTRLANIALLEYDSSTISRNLDEAYKVASAVKDSLILGSIYSTKATYLAEYGKIDQAIENYIASIPYLQKRTQSMMLASTYRKIAYLFQRISNWDKTKEYTNKAFQIADEKNYTREKAFIKCLMGEIALYDNDFDNAIKLTSEALDLFKNKNNSEYLLFGHITMATAYLSTGQIQKALENINIAEQYKDNTGVIAYKYQLHYIYASIAFELKDKNMMKAHIDQCIEMSHLIDVDEEKIKTLKLQRLYQELLGNYNAAIKLSDRYHYLKDSLYRNQQNKVVYELEAKYQKANQDKEIELLSTENKFKASILEQQKLLLTVTILGLFVLGILSFLSFSLYRKVKQQNEIVNSALEVKDTLLREIHHRVKNNLQIISSLLALQSKYIDDEEALKALQQGQDRVQTMALIHQDLYETESLTGVNAELYLHQLVDKLMDSYRYNEDDVDVNIEIENLTLDLDTMIPLGLIVNELVSNSFKHAFKNDTVRASIHVKLFESDNELVLEVGDNGTGLKDLKDLEGKSFGFELVKAFAKKIKAKIDIDNNNGFTVRLNILNYHKLEQTPVS